MKIIGLTAHIADIGTLKQAFADGIDIHSLTASQMFDVPLAEMTPEIGQLYKDCVSGAW